MTCLTDAPTGGGGATVDFQYSFSATQNNGKITKMKDWVTGEEVNYLGMSTYDRSNHLITSNGASYYYDHNNERIWKKRPPTCPTTSPYSATAVAFRR